MSSLLSAVEDKKADADTHLAEARRQNTENGILGDTKDKGSCFGNCFIFKKTFLLVSEQFTLQLKYIKINLYNFLDKRRYRYENFIVANS